MNRARQLLLDGSEEQIQDAIKDALKEAEYGRLINDSARATKAAKEAFRLSTSLIRAKRQGTVLGSAAKPGAADVRAAHARSEFRATLVGVPAPAVGSAPGAPDGKKPSGKYSFVTVMKGKH